MSTEFFLAGIKTLRDEGGGGILLGDNAGGVAITQQLLRLQCWDLDLDFNWTPLYHINMFTSPHIEGVSRL